MLEQIQNYEKQIENIKHEKNEVKKSIWKRRALIGERGFDQKAGNLVKRSGPAERRKK